MRPWNFQPIYISSPDGRQTVRLVRGFALVIFLVPLSAFAALGGNLNSVVNDQVHLQGALESTQMASFTVHEIRPPTGIVIREYVSPSGTVFGVSWQGPWLPDLRQLLGAYFQQYADAAQAHTSSHPGRGPVQIVQPDFILQQSGHLRSFVGKAYLPQMLPAGVTAEAIQ